MGFYGSRCFLWFLKVTCSFFMVQGVFLWVLKVPGWFVMVPDGVFMVQVGFSWFMVLAGRRLTLAYLL